MKPHIILAAILLLTLRISAQPTIPNPAQRDTIFLDLGSPNVAEPGDKIRYKVIIQNTGNASATMAQIMAGLDPRTTFIPGSFKTSPLATPDAYAVTGNVGINVPDGASDLLSNDFDDNIPGLTITTGTFATTGGGSIMINADGSFMYTPPAGFTGSDTYTYTLHDGNAVPGVTPTDIGLITFTISNLIYFIDNSSVAATSDGRLTSPFKSLANFNAGSAVAGNVIYIEHTGTIYTGGIVLQDNEYLYGEGHTGGANLANVLPFSLAANSKTLPNINGTRPIITNASGDGVTLAMNNNLRGFDVGACSDFGMDNTGTNSIGNLIVSEVAVNNTTAGGFDASNGSGASMNAVFSSISSAGGPNGIDLTNCAGTFNGGTGTLAGSVGAGFLISGGTATITYSGAISTSGSYAVDIDNHDSNNITFQTGNITNGNNGIRIQNCGGGIIAFNNPTKTLSTGANKGVTLANNTGATINFTNNNLGINTTSGIGFDATGGGTVNVSGTNNTISTNTGIGINIQTPTNIGTGVTFKSINVVNGASNSATSGIVLNGTSGPFKVEGDGTLARNGSGGTINKTTNDAIDLNNASNVTLQSMNLTANGDTAPGGLAAAESAASDHTIQAVGGSNLVLSGILIDNPTGTGMLIINVGGTNRVNSNTLITNLADGQRHGIFVSNTDVNMGLFEFKNSTMNNSLNDASMFFIANNGTSNMTLDVKGSTFENLDVQALTVAAGGQTATTGTLTSTIGGPAVADSNRFLNAHTFSVSGVNFSAENNVGILVNNGATHISTLERNRFDNICEEGQIANTSIIRTQNSSGKMTATVKNNVIKNIAFATSAGGRHVIGHIFEPVGYNAADFSNLIFEGNVASNITYTSTNREFVFVDFRAPASNGELTILNNTWNMPTPGGQQGIELRCRQTASSTVNVLIQGNNGTFNTAAAGIDIDSEDGATVNATITSNTLTDADAANGFAISVATEDGVAGGTNGDLCGNISGNVLSSAGNMIELVENTETMTITQASAAAMTTANGGATVTVTGTPTFGQPACTLP